MATGDRDLGTLAGENAPRGPTPAAVAAGLGRADGLCLGLALGGIVAVRQEWADGERWRSIGTLAMDIAVWLIAVRMLAEPIL